jgi:hypothetical protein
VKAFPEQIRERTMAMYPAATPFDAWVAVLDFYLENNAEQNALFFELLSLIPRNADIAKSFSANMQFVLSKATAGVEEHQRQGLFADSDPRTVALAIMSVFHGLRTLSLMGVGKEELRERGMEIGKVLLGFEGEIPGRAGKEKKSQRTPEG